MLASAGPEWSARARKDDHEGVRHPVANSAPDNVGKSTAQYAEPQTAVEWCSGRVQRAAVSRPLRSPRPFGQWVEMWVSGQPI